jgi:protein O-GlcNAc transferase
MNPSRTANIEHWLQEAINSQRSGNLNRAGMLYEKVLRYDPENADALHLLGIIDSHRGEAGKACSRIQSAIASDPTVADFYRSLGRVKRRIGKIHEAFIAYHKATELNPLDAISVYELGGLWQKLGNPDKAMACYRRSLSINPNFSECYNGLGLSFKSKRKIKEAIQCLKKAVQINPGLIHAYNNLGTIYKDLGAFQSAIRFYTIAIEKNPKFSQAYYNLGIVLNEIGRFHDAIACYRQALKYYPDFIEVYNNLGISLEKVGKTDAAMRFFEMAMKLDPENSSAYLNAGIIQYHQNNLSLSIEYTKKAIDRKKGDIHAYIILFEQLREGCCWKEAKAIEDIIDASTSDALQNGKTPFESPFLAITRSEDRQRNMNVASAWGGKIQEDVDKLASPFHHNTRNKKKITVGFLSNRFRNAATGHLMAKLFGLFDKQRFNIHCYSWGENDGSYFRNAIESNCTRFVDISKLGFIEAAELVNRDGVNILVDLKGFTRNNRMEICALKPAPIQIAYMNFNGTSGAPFFDYLIGDRNVIPENHQNDYSEKIIYMPQSFMVTDATLGKDIESSTRSVHSLPKDVFVYCCFNQFYKIEPSLFSCWMKILRDTENSVLWLLHGNDVAVQNLNKEAIHQGVDPKRLLFAPKLSKKDHLKRLQLADAVLDTKTCNGHTTTVDALLAGVPVVTMKGNHFASRVSSSLLAAMGLEELIATEAVDYVDLAIRLCSDSKQHRLIKSKLSRNRYMKALFDTKRFARNLENAFEQIWDIYSKIECPRHIYVNDCGPTYEIGRF